MTMSYGCPPLISRFGGPLYAAAVAAGPVSGRLGITSTQGGSLGCPGQRTTTDCDCKGLWAMKPGPPKVDSGPKDTE